MSVNSSTYLQRVDFDCTVDYLAMTYIMKSKPAPVNARIKRLLEVLSVYSFNLYYMKDKYVTLSDFLSRIKVDKSNPHEIIPISFDLQEVLQEKYYIHSQSDAQKGGTAVGKVPGQEKPLLLHMKPEKTAKISSELPSSSLMNHPHLGRKNLIRRGLGIIGFWEEEYQVHTHYSNHKYCLNHLSLKGQHYFLIIHKFQVYKE